MTIQEILNIEMKYLSMFSHKIPCQYGHIFSDPLQYDKYSHNLMMVLNKSISVLDINMYEQKQREYGFVIYRLENQIQMDFKDYEEENCGYFSAPIHELKVLNHQAYDISLLDPNDDHFFDYMYQEDLEFGKSYAKGNIKRQKEVLQKNSHCFFYIKAIFKEEVVGNLNAFIDGKYAKIDEFYVKEKFQRQGIGSALMSYMINLLKNKGVTDVYLVTNLSDTAKNLYKRMGYIQKGSYVQYKKMFPNH